MSIWRQVVCTICWLVAVFAHLTATIVEAAHPPQPTSREPAIKAPAGPADYPHVELPLPAIVWPPEPLPPGQGNTLDVAVQIARQHFQAQWRRPPFLNFSMAQD